MKNHNIKLLPIVLIIIGSAFGLQSCGEDFLEQEPTNQITAKNFIKSDNDLTTITGNLYAEPWWDYYMKFGWAINELQAGNGIATGGEFIPFNNRTYSGSSPQIKEGWRSLYTVIGSANNVMSTIKTLEPSGELTQAGINNAEGEARFVRGLAYYYLSQLWGDAPIIYDNAAQLAETSIPKAPVADVLRFAAEDLEASSTLITKFDHPKVSSYSAKAMLAKVKISQGEYAEAATLAKDVIDKSPYKLLENFGDLWYHKNENNLEGMFILQWADNCLGTGANWGNNNWLQAFWGYDGVISKAGDGWNAMDVTWDAYESFDSGDKRRIETIMYEGDKFPQLNTVNGGLEYSGINDNGGLIGVTGISVKKYVIGDTDDQEGSTTICQMDTGINTPVLRFADVYLTLAEAILAESGSTTNKEAIDAVNVIRKRAGLGEISEVNDTNLLEERRHEFMFELQYWFDWKRLYDRNPTEALTILNSVDRAGSTVSGGVLEKNTPSTVTFSEANILLPYPEDEIIANPALKGEAVPFFK